ncbi:MAG: glycosyltransferase family 39 protein [PVC group bacterium]
MDKKINKKQTGQLLFLIFLLVLGLRIWSLSCYRFVGADGGIDGVSMAVSGKNLFSGNGLVFQGRAETIHSPAFPVLVGLFWAVTGNLELGGQLVSVVFGALLVFPVFWMGKILFDGRIGIYAALLSAVLPPFIYTSTEIRVVSLYTTLFIFSLLLIYRFALQPGFRSGLAAGAGISLAYLTRPEAMLLLPLAAVLPFLAGSGRDKRGTGSIAAGWAGMAVGFSVISLPYWIFLRRHLGYWAMNGRGPFTFLGYFGEGWEKENFYLYTYRDQALQDWIEGGGIGGFFREHRGEILRRLFYNLFSFIDLGNSSQVRTLGLPRLLVDGVVAAALLAFLLAQIRKIIRRQWRFRDTFFLLALATVLPYLALSGIDMRYYYPYLPLAVILLAAFIVRWAGRAGTRGGSPVVRWIFAAGPAWVLVALSLLSTLYLIPRKIETVPYEYKILGEWMAENLPGVSDEVIVSRKMGVPFYMGSPHALPYPGSYDEMLEHARRSGGKYLVIDEWTIPWARPKLAFLLQEKEPPPELEKVHEIDYQGRKTILYKFK